MPGEVFHAGFHCIWWGWIISTLTVTQGSARPASADRNPTKPLFDPPDLQHHWHPATEEMGLGFLVFVFFISWPLQLPVGGQNVGAARGGLAEQLLVGNAGKEQGQVWRFLLSSFTGTLPFTICAKLSLN